MSSPPPAYFVQSLLSYGDSIGLSGKVFLANGLIQVPPVFGETICQVRVVDLSEMQSAGKYQISLGAFWRRDRDSPWIITGATGVVPTTIVEG
jgi:hypothetical protein